MAGISRCETTPEGAFALLTTRLSILVHDGPAMRTPMFQAQGVLAAQLHILKNCLFRPGAVHTLEFGSPRTSLAR